MGEIYRFGQFELRPDRLELRRAGAVVSVEPKPLQLLTELLRNAGELVTKNELLDTVWAQRIVSDSVIARCVNKLRDALGDHAQTLVLNVHGHGYRFNGPVVVDEDRAGQATLALEPPGPGGVPPLRPNWRLVRQLDEDGAIWLAQHDKTGEKRVFKYGFDAQRVPALRREVALNRLLLKGLGERPDIARLLDYNLTEPPYFIELEYCPLGNLAEWCAARGGIERVPLDLRLELLAEAAETLAAAHAIGVLHMDVKPSNLLVWQDSNGKVRLRWSDFGSGRLLEPGRLRQLGITELGSTKTLLGEAGSLRGTLHYIAPELLGGAIPTIKSDIYALGVLLYQLVAGDLRKPMAAGWERNVADPLLCSDIAATANDDPAQRIKSADELAIRLRTLEQRRQERAARQNREREAVLMRQKVERARARRPWLIAAALALAAGVGVSTWNYWQAVRARDAAREQASIADAVIDFLDRDILSEGSPFSVSAGGSTRVTVREAVDRAASKLGGRFDSEPGVESSIRAAIGQVYVEDGDYDAAEGQIRKAVELGRSARGGVDERTLQAEYGLAFALLSEQKLTEARRLLDEADRAVAGRSTVSPRTASRHDVINGNYYLFIQDFRRAVPYFERGLAEALQYDPTNVSQVVIRQTSLAWCYAALGRFEYARPLYAAALATMRRAEPTAGTLTGTVEERYGIGLFLAGRNDEAKSMLQSAYSHLRASIGDDGLTAEALTYLGWLQLREGRLTEAAASLEKAYHDEVVSAGAEHHMTLRARGCLDIAQFAGGRRTESVHDLSGVVSAYEHVLGAGAPETQLFRFFLLEESLQVGATVPDVARQLKQLDPERISQAAPWQDWKARLAELKSKLARAAT